MCIAVPGKIIEVDGTRGKVDVRGNTLSVELGIVRANVGDFVLIHAGLAIAVVAKSEAAEILELMDLVDGYAGET